MIGDTLRACGSPSVLHSYWQCWSYWIFWPESGRQAIVAYTIDDVVLSRIDVTIRSIDPSSPPQCHDNSWELIVPTLFPAMFGSTWATIKQNSSTSKSIEVLQCTFISEDLWFQVCSCSSSLPTRQQAEQMKHQGVEIHIKMDETRLLRWRFVHFMHTFLKANLHKFVQCCLELLTFMVGLDCHATFPKDPFKYLITDLSNAMM
jgi:hypothetical protein